LPRFTRTADAKSQLVETRPRVARSKTCSAPEVV
jgi:hypothetical protein